MGSSYEYTYWHLTPEGWLPGTTKTDTNKWELPEPVGTVKTVRYVEKMSYSLNNSNCSETISEISDKKIIADLEKKFIFKGSIYIHM